MPVRKSQPIPPADQWLPTGDQWRCPACGKQFVQRGIWHSCAAVSLDDHFVDRPRARELFDAFHTVVAEAGPFRLSIARTRIGFINGITFLSVTPRIHHLRVGLVLLERLESPRFSRVEQIEKWWLHTLDIRHVAEIDEELRGWTHQAYAEGVR
jgi:hypothetical protein